MIGKGKGKMKIQPLTEQAKLQASLTFDAMSMEIILYRERIAALEREKMVDDTERIKAMASVVKEKTIDDLKYTIQKQAASLLEKEEIITTQADSIRDLQERLAALSASGLLEEEGGRRGRDECAVGVESEPEAEAMERSPVTGWGYTTTEGVYVQTGSTDDESMPPVSAEQAEAADGRMVSCIMRARVIAKEIREKTIYKAGYLEIDSPAIMRIAIALFNAENQEGG